MVKVLAPARDLATAGRVWLSEPTLVFPGDRFVLRRPSPAQTVAGGFIIDTFPPIRLNRARTVARLESLGKADVPKRLAILIEGSSTGRSISDLVRLTGRPAAEISSAVSRNTELVLDPASQRAVSKGWLAQKSQKLLSLLTAYHAKNPSAAGAPIAVARMGLEPALAQLVFAKTAGIRVQGDLVSLAAHKAQLSNVEMQALSRIESTFRQAGFQPPAPGEVLQSAGLDANRARGLLEALIKNQKLVRISETLVFHADAILHIRKSLSAHRGRRFSVPEFKEWTQISRKYAIPLLEYLDNQRVTRRDGDSRIVL
jgi:selenocysteine-specific elongation factor